MLQSLFFASGSSDGDAFLGFLIIGLVIWVVVAVCRSGKKKGWDVETHGKTTIKPRR